MSNIRFTVGDGYNSRMNIKERDETPLSVGILMSAFTRGNQNNGNEDPGQQQLIAEYQQALMSEVNQIFQNNN
jgi:hypothetical protein